MARGGLFEELEKVEGSSAGGAEPKEEKRDYLTVSEFLDGVNDYLRLRKTFVAGEVTEFKPGAQWTSFSLKDKEGGAILRCFLATAVFRKFGVLLEDGLCVKVRGYSRVYKPMGSFSFYVEEMELLGEGSLKKAYEMLLKKLRAEGLFARKRPIPKFVKTIGVVSSREGVVIQDFRKNLKPLGFKIKFIDSRVEGADAVPGLLRGIKWFNKKMPASDVLVILRGGGSLESMQAFNNELVCREIFNSKIPVLCGIGHDVDVPIACLVADVSASTPTGASFLMNATWDGLLNRLPILSKGVFSEYEMLLKDIYGRVDIYLEKTTSSFKAIFAKFRELARATTRGALQKIAENISRSKMKVDRIEKLLEIANPERNLRLGFSIIFDKTGKVIKDAGTLKKGDKITSRFNRGEAESIIDVIKN